MQKYGISEHQACLALGVNRSSIRQADDEELLTKDILRLTQKYGRYGYRGITSLLQVEGWKVNHKRVERIWREQGLKIPKNNLKENVFI